MVMLRRGTKRRQPGGSQAVRALESHEANINPADIALLRQIPAVDELLGRPALRSLESRVGRRLLVDSTRKVLQGLRGRIARGEIHSLSLESLERDILAATEGEAEHSLRPVINATGVILHTNLGRAPLAAEAIREVASIAGQYSNLEYDLADGTRGQRDAHTDRLFAQLLHAERTLVVNNNAAAVFLALNSLAEGGEVIVSRGELIEIGGSFRIPDICAKSGARLREVGTTNRTRISDYAAAINDHTRILMRVHPSNFRMVGFTERPELVEIVRLAREHDLLVLEDLGSGCLLDFSTLGIRDEPPAAASIVAGVDVVTFSGDKMLGGPQAGILAGKREPLETIRRNPLFRALRVDKMMIAALAATVTLYLRDNRKAIPALRMISMTREEVGARAERLATKILSIAGFSVSIEDGESVVGGGSTPGQSLPTRLIGVTHKRLSATSMEAGLRRNSPPIIARIEHDQLLLDLRTVFEGQEAEILGALQAIGGSDQG
jgi:L-seryl-tRNA(Ser) seleniumtransferase